MKMRNFYRLGGIACDDAWVCDEPGKPHLDTLGDHRCHLQVKPDGTIGLNAHWYESPKWVEGISFDTLDEAVQWITMMEANQ